MEQITFKKGILTFKRKLKSGETYRIDKRRKYTSVSIIKAPLVVTGVSSRTKDNRDILFMDYDNCDLSLVKSDYTLIQEMFNLPPGYLLTTKIKKKNGEDYGNFHIICLIKKNPVELYEMMKHTHIDANYLDSPIRNRQKCLILRISKKGKRPVPKYLGLIGEVKNLDQEISTAHKRFLSGLHKNIVHPKYTNEDGLKKIFLQDYETV
ncbi:MAG: hypothetical protein WCX73_05390 [Candidatus Pacearchaeota archaeon]